MRVCSSCGNADCFCRIARTRGTRRTGVRDRCRRPGQRLGGRHKTTACEWIPQGRGRSQAMHGRRSIQRPIQKQRVEGSRGRGQRAGARFLRSDHCELAAARSDAACRRKQSPFLHACCGSRTCGCRGRGCGRVLVCDRNHRGGRGLLRRRPLNRGGCGVGDDTGAVGLECLRRFLLRGARSICGNPRISRSRPRS